MMMPFGGMGMNGGMEMNGGMGMIGRRPFGGNFGGFGIMDDFDDMMGMMGMMGGMRAMGGGMSSGQMMMSAGGMGGGQMMMSSFGGGMGGGSFTSQTMCFSSSMGADGKMKTEKFASSSVGDARRGIAETQHAYSNSVGVDKMSMERLHGERGKKVVKERCSVTGDETQTEMFHGMTEEDQDDFHEAWEREAAPYLPQHRNARALCGVQSRPQQPRAIGYYANQDQPSAMQQSAVAYQTMQSPVQQTSSTSLPHQHVHTVSQPQHSANQYTGYQHASYPQYNHASYPQYNRRF